MNFSLYKAGVRTYLKAVDTKDAAEFCATHGYESVERFHGRIPACVAPNCLCTDKWFDKNF